VPGRSRKNLRNNRRLRPPRFPKLRTERPQKDPSCIQRDFAYHEFNTTPVCGDLMTILQIIRKVRVENDNQHQCG